MKSPPGKLDQLNVFPQKNILIKIWYCHTNSLYFIQTNII
jgi:hypothetical protein